jgi:signal transduction histidine kinase
MVDDEPARGVHDPAELAQGGGLVGEVREDGVADDPGERARPQWEAGGVRLEAGRLARSFNEMAGQIEATIVALRRFVSDAAHQLHTPLTALHTNLELATDGASDDRQAAYLERAQGQVARLERLADELLQLSRIEAGVHGGDRRPVDLAALVRELAEAQAARADQVGLSFTLDVPDGAVMVAGYEEQLAGVLENLADNALKFTPAGGSVIVKLRATSGWAELSVTDTGVGIPMEDLPQLFSRFHRGRNAAAYPGSGLGLAIVKAVAEHHGGCVSAANTGHGARFSVRLPLA